MGCASSHTITSTTSSIDKSIRQDQNKRSVKLLLLGTGESGKSTFLRQMKAMHTDGFRQLERLKFGEVLKHNALDTIKTLAQLVKSENEVIPKKNDDGVICC
eukprot:TRINITY_DN5667_c0_g1_i1.p1 TRINITY_DN5667_c0_g1~~TRINITY_DN5667_c0_g1_i1.p1  ORF type:complete len:120 (-),score=4.49 TRINITY_DN5667_c0_g1_i1:114-419(-)